MDITPQILTANVMHKRFFPKENGFNYGVFNVCLPLPASPLPSKIMSFHSKDHGARDGSPLETWARAILNQCGFNALVHHICLITMPRVFGYGFNPVSFYLCLDENKHLRAVIAQVHNTFGEAHSYLCVKDDKSIITADTLLKAQKLFHVSPFLERNGSYQFQFMAENSYFSAHIHYYDAKNQKQLVTSIRGKLSPLTAQSLRKAFFTHPFVTLKVLSLIHWQALKLFAKGIKVITKPKQIIENISKTKRQDNV